MIRERFSDSFRGRADIDEKRTVVGNEISGSHTDRLNCLRARELPRTYLRPQGILLNDVDNHAILTALRRFGGGLREFVRPAQETS